MCFRRHPKTERRHCVPVCVRAGKTRPGLDVFARLSEQSVRFAFFDLKGELETDDTANALRGKYGYVDFPSRPRYTALWFFARSFLCRLYY
jgi:hypothetical protein